MLAEQLLVHPGFVVKSFGESDGHELAEVSVSLQVHGQKDEVIVVLFVCPVYPLTVMPAGRRHVDFTTDDGFDALSQGLAVKFDRPEHVPMVGHGQGGLFEFLCPLQERIDLVGAIQQAVLCVAVQVDERGMLHVKVHLTQTDMPDNIFSQQPAFHHRRSIHSHSIAYSL